MYEQIIQGVIGGIAVALAGFAKKDSTEGFDWKKIVPTLVISAVVGAIAGYTGQDYGMVANSAIAMGITSFIEDAGKAINRKLFNKESETPSKKK